MRRTEVDLGDLRKHLWPVLLHDVSRSGPDFTRRPTAQLHSKFLSLPLKPIDECFTRQNRCRCHRNVRFRARALLDLNLLAMERQALNVARMQFLGAKVISVTAGQATLKEAISEAMRDWVTNVRSTHYILGSALGSHPYPMAYVACGRLDAYIEQGISLWDIAAGWILVETAGGSVEMKPRMDMPERYSIIASNGVIDLKL